MEQRDDRTAGGPAEASSVAGLWHDKLLQASGVLPDELVRMGRRWLATGADDDVRRALRFAGPRSAAARPSDWVHVAPLPGPCELVAAAAATASAAEVIAAWAALRFPADGAPWPPATTVVTVQVADGTAAEDRARLAEEVVELLDVTSPETDPAHLVEVVDANGLRRWDLSAVQAANGGALVWSRDQVPLPRVAPALCRPAPGPGPADLDDELLSAVLEALDATPVVVTSSGRGPDLVTGEADAVPVGARSDGTWAFPEAVVHYAAAHGLLPVAELVEHLLARGPSPVVLTPAQRSRALDAVLEVPGGLGWSGALEEDT